LEVPEGTIDAYKQKGWNTLDEGGVFKEIREIPEYDANGDGQTTIVDVTRLVDKIMRVCQNRHILFFLFVNRPPGRI